MIRGDFVMKPPLKLLSQYPKLLLCLDSQDYYRSARTAIVFR